MLGYILIIILIAVPLIAIMRKNNPRISASVHTLRAETEGYVDCTNSVLNEIRSRTEHVEVTFTAVRPMRYRYDGTDFIYWSEKTPSL